MPFEPAARVAGFGPSVFTTITELAARHNAIDLSTGFPDTDGPEAVKAAAIRAIQDGPNQYALSHGTGNLRRAVAAHIQRFYGQAHDPETEITITNGAAEALHSVMDGLINPGDEVILFEPFYEVYPPNVVMAGGVPRYVPLRPPDWSFDPAELAAAFNAAHARHRGQHAPQPNRQGVLGGGAGVHRGNYASSGGASQLRMKCMSTCSTAGRGMCGWRRRRGWPSGR